jgi:hypothetical protein
MFIAFSYSFSQKRDMSLCNYDLNKILEVIFKKKKLFILDFSKGPERVIRYRTRPPQEAVLRRRHNRVKEETQSVTG